MKKQHKIKKIPTKLLHNFPSVYCIFSVSLQRQIQQKKPVIAILSV